MQISPFTLLTLGLALVQTTSAIPAPAGALTCPGYRYSRHQVEMAIKRGIFNTPTVNPQPGGYPHTFGNNRRLPFSQACKGKKLWEFPLLHGDRIYGGGNPGADRVVFYIYTSNPDTDPTQNGAYCGVMTHDGSPVNEFALCPVED